MQQLFRHEKSKEGKYSDLCTYISPARQNIDDKMQLV